MEEEEREALPDTMFKLAGEKKKRENLNFKDCINTS